MLSKPIGHAVTGVDDDHDSAPHPARLTPRDNLIPG